MNTSRAHPPWRAIAIVVAVVLAITLPAFAAACGWGAAVGDGGAVSTVTTAGRDTTTVTEPAQPSDSTITSEANGGRPESTTSTSTTSGSTFGTSSTTVTTAAQETMTVNVYFARGEKIAAAGRVIPKTQGVGAAAIRALLAGPTAPEKAAGMVSTIPKGSTLLGLNIKNGTATVDLSKEYASGGGSLSMMMRLAQVVFTLTQFPTVHGVTFMLDGKPIDVLGGEGIIIDHPMTRADYEDLSPAILVESPTLGGTIHSPTRATGTANVFEAVFRINIVDNDGLIIADERVRASSGTGTRGTFDVTIPYPEGHMGPGSLIVFENSAKDGSPINVVEIPIVLK